VSFDHTIGERTVKSALRFKTAGHIGSHHKSQAEPNANWSELAHLATLTANACCWGFEGNFAVGVLSSLSEEDDEDSESDPAAKKRDMTKMEIQSKCPAQKGA
jgi:hypothetical protein